MKKAKTSQLENSKTNNNSNQAKQTHTFSLTNEEFLKRSLRLLGVTEEQFEKETKVALRNQLFAKTLPNPTNSKQFFFISFICAKNLFEQEVSELSMWYPPKTVNEQVQFKKVFFKLLQKWQAENKVPKKLIISRMSLMGDAGGSSVLEFLRIISELSLRAVYLRKYSKTDRLVQIAVNQYTTNNDQLKNPENDINKFYVFPFSQTVTNVEPPISSQLQLQSIKRIFKIHIEHYRKRILALRTVQETEVINPQSVMSQILEQKQLSNTLLNKVSKTIYSQNRAFDRRVIIDKHQHIWKELNRIGLSWIQSGQEGILKIEGETDKRLKAWKLASGTAHLSDFVSEKQKLSLMRSKCTEKLEQLKKVKQLLRSTILQ